MFSPVKGTGWGGGVVEVGVGSLVFVGDTVAVDVGEDTVAIKGVVGVDASEDCSFSDWTVPDEQPQRKVALSNKMRKDF